MTTATSAPSASTMPTNRPWPALWSLIVGFFMILLDSTIVSVANPAIQKSLNTDINSVIWVTSAYLLAYAVPLLVTGRLGDRFGPKNIYLAGLVIFTLSSAWCGLSGSIGILIVARAAQGIGAALMAPQTMAVITRIFPPDRRGAAMGVWGSVAGVATLVGPIAGGLLVDGLGWEWIFFINVPIGVVGFILAAVNVPKLETREHSFDILGVVLSAAGLFLLVFGIQEGDKYKWGTITGPISVWGLIIAGLVVLTAFVVWQALNKKEPLLPLGLFRDRNFTLSNAAITVMGFVITALVLPVVYYLQIVRDLTPTQSALMLVPMAVAVLAFAPIVGRSLDTRNPRNFAIVGFVLLAVALFLYSWMLSPTVALGWLLIPAGVLGLASAFIWAPLSNTATRNLPPSKAGAGAGVYNTTRQIGSVLGSASIATLIESRLTADLPKVPGQSSSSSADFASAKLPDFLHLGFTNAMSESLLMPAIVTIVAIVVVVFFAKPVRREGWAGATGSISVAKPATAEPAASVSAEAESAVAEPAVKAD